jgi:hypothetical protein
MNTTTENKADRSDPLHRAGSADSVQKKKIAWLIEQGGTLIDDDADESIVKYRSAYSVIDKWGRVVWMTKPPGHVL